MRPIGLLLGCFLTDRLNVDNSDIIELRDREREWFQTTLGRLWLSYEHASSRLSQAEMNENIQWSTLKRRDDEYKEARAALLREIRGF